MKSTGDNPPWKLHDNLELPPFEGAHTLWQAAVEQFKFFDCHGGHGPQLTRSLTRADYVAWNKNTGGS